MPHLLGLQVWEAIVSGESTGRSCPCGSDGQFEQRARASTIQSLFCLNKLGTQYNETFPQESLAFRSEAQSAGGRIRDCAKPEYQTAAS